MTNDPPPPITDTPTSSPTSPRRKNRRLRFLYAVVGVSLGLYVFVRLDRSTAEWLGPVGAGIHDLFNQVPGKAQPLTSTGRRFEVDVKALGGQPSVFVLKPGFLGTIGQQETFNAWFRGQSFDDQALERLAESHGERILGLYLENTAVTDAGLKSLSKFTALRHLVIRDYPMPFRPGQPPPTSPITDAGMVHLKGLKTLWSVDLSYHPITDAGLEALSELPELNSVYLSHSEVRGPGLARLKSLPRWNILYLDHGKMTDDGLKALAAATSLQYLSLNGVPLETSALPLLKALPRIERLDLTGCGFLDEEVADLIKSKPGLKVERH